MSGSAVSSINGEWAYDGEFDGAPSYKRFMGSYFYMFYSPQHNSYDIGEIKGGTDFIAYCFIETAGSTSVTDCGQWTSITLMSKDKGASVSSCGGDTARAPSPPCLRVSNMQSTFNGEWIDLGVSNNGQTVYQLGEHYLFYTLDGNNSYAYWTINREHYFNTADDEDDFEWSYGWCSNYDITQCDGEWESYDGSASSSTFTDCQTFISSDLACLEDSPYAEQLCLSSALLWSNATTQFAVSTEECLEDQPLFVSANDSYHLHYSPHLKYVDDEELSPRWVMSEGVVQNRGPAYCYQEDLRDCVVGEWQVLSSDADTIEYVADELMSYAECGATVVSDEKEENENNDTAAIGALIWALVLVLPAIFGFVIYRRSVRKDKIEVAFEEDEIENDEEEGEIEIEIDIETQLNITR